MTGASSAPIRFESARGTRQSSSVHVYVHVPFCARRCSYCDFAIAVRSRVPGDDFASLVALEWARREVWAGWREPGALATLYLGGGTPSRLGVEPLASLITRIAREGPLAPGAEVTLEANPEDVTAEAARAWRQAGIGRVSLGAQSFHPPTLAWMHRGHDPERIGAAVRILRAAGVDDLSLDLIYGVPDRLGRDWGADLDRALALEPDHLSLYGLTVETATPLGKWVARGAALPPSDERAADEYLVAHDRIRGAGYEHYEVSNAARPGHRSRHNLGYWRREPYLGLGPSAHSAAGGRRWWNIPEWERYRRTVAGGASPVAGRETIDAEAARLETRYLGLRTDEGIPAALVPEPARRTWERAGWARSREGRRGARARGMAPARRPGGLARLSGPVRALYRPSHGFRLPERRSAGVGWQTGMDFLGVVSLNCDDAAS